MFFKTLNMLHAPFLFSVLNFITLIPKKALYVFLDQQEQTHLHHQELR